MAKKRSTLDKMAANPHDDWTIENVKTLVKQEGLEIRSPSGGSHHVVSSPLLRDSVCVPHKRPIKSIYIVHLVHYAEAHRKAEGGQDDG